MFQLRRRGPVSYDDVLREMEGIERQMLHVDSAMAMNLMVIEAKLRERFRQMETLLGASSIDNALGSTETLTMEEIRAMIPRDLPAFPTFEDLEPKTARVKTLETVGMAGVLAIVTALGVFGLASVLQMALSWLA